MWHIVNSDNMSADQCIRTHVRLKSPYPLRNPELGFFLSGSWEWFVFGAQEQLWSDAIPDTTNDPDGIQIHNTALSNTVSAFHNFDFDCLYEAMWK